MRAVADAFEGILRAHGYRYRRHGYEFYIGDGRHFLFVVVFFPQWKQVVAFVSKYGEKNGSLLIKQLENLSRQCALRLEVRRLSLTFGLKAQYSSEVL